MILPSEPSLSSADTSSGTPAMSGKSSALASIGTAGALGGGAMDPDI